MTNRINWNPDWRDPENMHANLLTTFGLRAGYMAAEGRIYIPGNLAGEDALAAVAIHAVEEWESRKSEAFSFDEHIEDTLLAHFPLPGKED